MAYVLLLDQRWITRFLLFWLSVCALRNVVGLSRHGWLLQH
jgi:hypothetical protein